jgi:hypothetical protein
MLHALQHWDRLTLLLRIAACSCSVLYLLSLSFSSTSLHLSKTSFISRPSHDRPVFWAHTAAGEGSHDDGAAARVLVL